MSALAVLVDYDNIEPAHRSQGPISLVRMILSHLPANLLHPYSGVQARLYGGWRTATGLTTLAQELIPDLRANSPTMVSVAYVGVAKSIKVDVTLAQGPLGTRKVLEETHTRNRELRHFHSRPQPWQGCADAQNCGFKGLSKASKATPCGATGCFVRLGDILAQNEQKMVDTLLVADIAHQTFIAKANEVVVVCSDADIWPGIFLALQAGCRVTQLHAKKGWNTPRTLLDMLDHPLQQRYRQLSL